MSRWDELFADLEARADAIEHAERAAEVDERARIELAGLNLRDRLRPALGTKVRVRCLAGLTITGALRRVGAGWLLIDEGVGRESVLHEPGVLAISGLSRLVSAPAEASPVESGLGLGSVLRGIARDRSGLRLWLTDGHTLTGTVDRVGRDFLELAVHAVGEARRRDAVREVQVIAFAALVAVQRES